MLFVLEYLIFKRHELLIMKMRTLFTSLTALLAFGGFTYGGTPVHYQSSMPSSDLFGPETTVSAYLFYLEPDASVAEDGWGGGIGFDHFFTRYVGLSGSAAWADVDIVGTNDSELVHNYVGDLVVRLPMDSIRIAPYALAGVGLIYGGNDWEILGRAGAGIDFRITESFGLFGDWIYHFPDGSFGIEGEQYQTVRLGAKIAF